VANSRKLVTIRDHSVEILVDKDDLIKYQLLISCGLSRVGKDFSIFPHQPTVDKTIRDINQLLIEEGLWMIVDKV
jgi:hypothetical protein